MAPVRLEDLPCSLPHVPIPEGTDPRSVAVSFTPAFPSLQPGSFTPDALWRDQFALTGSLRTFYTSDNISTAWRETSEIALLGSFVLREDVAPRLVRLPNGAAWVDCWFSFRASRSPARSCTAIISLVPAEAAGPESGEWKIWMLRTILEQLDGCADVDSLQPAQQRLKANGLGSRRNGDAENSFECVVLGAGQSGLSTAGRLQALGVSYVVIERNKKVGDNWALRYKAMKLHTIREYAHLPFDRTFGPEYPEYIPRDDLARGYDTWAKKFGINVWLETMLVSGSWDNDKKQWTLNLRQGGKPRTITCSYLVLAMGAGCSVPYAPVYENRDIFGGDLLHSGKFVDSTKWAGKHGIVIGSANTAHDVAQDMLAAGLKSITMVQRSKTYVLPAEYYKKLTDGVYNSKIPTEISDRSFQSSPIAASRELVGIMLGSMARSEPERFDALERAGFKVDRGGNVIRHIYEHFGGHYMDVGASAQIAQGLIKVKSDSLPVRYTKTGLEFADGAVLDADVVVFATGFQVDMRPVIERLLGREVAAQVEPFWGLNEEGDLSGECRPLEHPALWMHGGTLGLSRYLSRFIALQIKAKLLGTPLPVYERKFSLGSA